MKKIILCAVSGLLILSIGIIPKQIIQNATHYSVITPSKESYQPQLICSGYVTAKEGIRMVVNGNVVVKELTAGNGSWVTAGQVIAITDAPDIADTFLSQSLEAPISNINSSDLSSLAAQYGMNIPTAHSEKLQTDINKLPTAEPTPKVAKAPISGIITWNDVSEGRFIPAGSPLCTILGLDNYKAIVQVPAEDAELIAIGAKAVISGSEIGNNSYVGTVTTVGNSISHGIVSGGYSSVID
ncbi:MAG: HlyD family efflux transporter periplasmic adaptor subunit, partial [Angelakisella sp.]